MQVAFVLQGQSQVSSMRWLLLSYNWAGSHGCRLLGWEPGKLTAGCF